MAFVYTGKLQFASNGEEDDLLSLDGEHFLADEIQEHISEHGHFLTVRYWVTDEEKTEEELNEALILMGLGEAVYAMVYSETTGYLWTDEELNVGGHNLKEELQSHIGKYLRMEIQFHESKPKN